MLFRAMLSLCLSLVFASALRGHPAEAPFRAISFEAALEAAKKEKKVVMVDFFTTWCGPCKKLDQITWRDERVKAFLEQKTVPLKIDAEKERPLAQRYRVGGYPTMVFVKPDGSEAGRLVGYLAPDVFLERAGVALVGDEPIARARQALVGHEEDPRLRQQLAEAHALGGELEAALRELLWCFDHGAEKHPAYAGVRGSFLLDELGRLAKKYPPAKDALLERRRRIAEGVLARTTPASDARLVARIDQELGQSAESLELYDELARRGGDGAEAKESIGAELLDVFIENRRYEDVLLQEKDAAAALERDILAARKQANALEIQRGQRAPETIAVFEAQLGALRRKIEHLARAYYEASLGAGRLDQADRIAALALGYEPTGAMCASLIDAAVRASAGAAGRKLGETWVATLPENEQAAIRQALARIPENG